MGVEEREAISSMSNGVKLGIDSDMRAKTGEGDKGDGEGN